MKKFLLSIFAVMLAVFSVQAETKTYTYDFSKNTNWVTTKGGSTAVATGSGNKLNAFYDKATGDVFNAGGKGYFNSGYFLWGKSGAYIELPTYSGEKITKVTAKSSSGVSTNVTVGVYNSTTSVATAVKWAKSTSYDYDIPEAYQSSVLRLQVTNGYNAQITQLVITTETASADFVKAPVISGDAEFVGFQDVVITAEKGDVYYSFEENGEYKIYTNAVCVEENVTIFAKAVDGDNESEIVSKSYTRVAAIPEFVFDGNADSFVDEIEVEIKTKNGAVAYYTLNGKNPDASSTVYEGPITIKADATLKAIAIEADEYESTIATQKFTVENNAGSGDGATATLVEDKAKLNVGDQIVITDIDATYALSTNQKSNNRGAVSVEQDGGVINLSGDVQIITLEAGSIEGTVAFNVGGSYLYAASSSSNHLKSGDKNDNASWLINITNEGAQVVAQGTNTRNILRYNPNNGSPLFSCYGDEKTGTRVNLYKVNTATIKAYTLTVSKAGWATLFLDYAVAIPEGVTCYTVSAVDGEYATLADVKGEGVIPANTAVIVEAEEGEYVFEVTNASTEVESNMLGTTVNKYIFEDAYVLGVVDGVVGLYKAEMAGGVWLNNANKAYLPASEVPTSAQGAASFSFRFGEGTTGIDEITENRVQSTVIYDLTGRRVEEITEPGIYIIGGRKVLVK